MLYKCILISIILWLADGLMAQDNLVDLAIERTQQGDIHIIAKYKVDSTILRWGYDHPAIWYGNLAKGVEIYRRKKDEAESAYALVAEVKMKTEAELEAMISTSSNPDMLMVITEQAYRNWENTKYDGSPAGLYDKSDNFYNRWSLFHFAAERDAVAADAAGLRWVDSDIEPNQTYAYKIVTKGLPYGRDFKVVRPYVKEFQPIIYDHTSYEEKVILQWEKPLHDIHYSAYNIEKKQGGQWVQVNEQPYVQMMDESLDIEQRFYTYPVPLLPGEETEIRIIGMDPFSDWSIPSAPIRVKSLDKTPPPQPIVSVDTSQIHLGVALTWTQDSIEDVDHYDVLIIESNLTERKQNWANKDARSGTITFAKKGIQRVKLLAIDAAGNESESREILVSVPDINPPAKPEGIKAHVDTLGIITLKWDDPVDQDVIGYYVFGADGDDRHMHRLTPDIWRAKIFFDTVDMAMLTEKRYYTVIAIDEDYRKSTFSDTIEVNRPDLIPPSPALLSDYSVTSEGIKFSLIPSSSRDVVHHMIERKINHPDSAWVTLEKMIEVPRTYTDKTVSPSSTYRYRFIGEDEVGQISKVVKDLVLTAGGLELMKPQLSASVEEESIRLSWEEVPLAQMVILYKSQDDGPMQKLTSMSVDGGEYIDKNVETDKTYTYRMRMVSKKGKKSPFSESVKMNK